MQWVVEHVVNHERLAELRLDVLSRTSVAVSACAYLEVEGAVDLE